MKMHNNQIQNITLFYYSLNKFRNLNDSISNISTATPVINNSKINNSTVKVDLSKFEPLIIGISLGIGSLVFLILIIFIILRKLNKTKINKTEKITSYVINKINTQHKSDNKNSEKEIKILELNNTKDNNDKTNKNLINKNFKDNDSFKNAIDLFKNRIEDMDLEQNILQDLKKITESNHINNFKSDNSTRFSRNDNGIVHISFESGERSEPGDSFYNIKLDELRDEKIANEKDEIEARIREVQLELEFRKKMINNKKKPEIKKVIKETKKQSLETRKFSLESRKKSILKESVKINNESNSFTEINSDGASKFASKFEVNDNALLTDYSKQIKHIPEFYKDIDHDD